MVVALFPCSPGRLLPPPPTVGLQRCWQGQCVVGAQCGWSSMPCVGHVRSLVMASKNSPAFVTGVDFDCPLD